MQSASYIPQPKVNTSLQNPSALHGECVGGETCIDHSDKHLTLQEHACSLLQLLIALNTFSYCGRFATNCSLLGRCCPHSGDRSPPAASEDSGVGCRSRQRGMSVYPAWPKDVTLVALESFLVAEISYNRQTGWSTRSFDCKSMTVVIVVQSLSCVRLCDPMDYSTPGLPVHHLPELAQTHVC